jgi:integrase
MRQCEIPLTDILFDGSNGGTITYWRTIDGRPLTKGNKPFSHPIDPRAVPLLKEIVAARRAEGSKSLCDVPSGGVPAGVIYRQFLDGVGFHKISHHGLRYTWITRAALSGRNGHRGISLAEAKRFVNHGSTAVHEIYQRLSVSDLVHVPDALDLVQL